MSKIFDKRKIRPVGNTLKPGESYIHPITLELRNVNKDSKSFTTPTEFYLSDDKNYPVYVDTETDKFEFKKLTKQELQLEMALPKTVYNEPHLLFIYDLKNIDQLTKWINNQIDQNIEFDTINRVINVFTLHKYEEFEKNSSYLVTMYKKILDHYFNKNLEIEIISKFIRKYIQNNNYQIFNFDIGDELIKNLI